MGRLGLINVEERGMEEERARRIRKRRKEEEDGTEEEDKGDQDGEEGKHVDEENRVRRRDLGRAVARRLLNALAALGGQPPCTSRGRQRRLGGLGGRQIGRRADDRPRTPDTRRLGIGVPTAGVAR